LRKLFGQRGESQKWISFPLEQRVQVRRRPLGLGFHRRTGGGRVGVLWGLDSWLTRKNGGGASRITCEYALTNFQGIGGKKKPGKKRD